MQALVSTVQQILANTKLSDLATQLLNNPAFQEGAQKLIKDKPEILPLIVQALVELAKNKPDEESIMKSINECGGLCSAFVENGLNISQDSAWMESIAHTALQCPFYKDDGIFYLSCDTKKEYPIYNGWQVRSFSVWAFPLKNQKIKQHEVLSPAAKYISSFWEGVSGTRMGTLLPPYHPVLIILLWYSPTQPYYIAIDCGREGVGVVSSAIQGKRTPIQNLLKEESGNAKCVLSISAPTPKIINRGPHLISEQRKFNIQKYMRAYVHMFKKPYYLSLMLRY